MKIKLLVLTLIYLFFGAVPVTAVTVTISNVPQTVTDQPFSFDVSIVGASAATNYLRADFFQLNGTNYFGYTNNGTAWYSGSDYNQYLPVAITSSGYSGTVQAKIDTASSRFTGNGTYNLRIRRYTQSGNYTAGESNIVAINVNLTSPTPTLTPPIPTPSPTPISTSTSPPASSFTISNVPSQINSDQSFNVSANLTLPNNKNTDYYLSGAFKKADGTRYFGLTKINTDWIKYDSSNYLHQYKITTDGNGNWTGVLEVKPDISDTDYKGSGDYIFKVARYTSSSSNPTWNNNESTIKIISRESDNPGNTSILASNNSSSATNPPVSLPSVKTTATTSIQPKNNDGLVYRIASVAGATASDRTSATSSSKVSVKNDKQINPFFWVGLIFIFAGAGPIGYIYLKKNAKIHI